MCFGFAKNVLACHLPLISSLTTGFNGLACHLSLISCLSQQTLTVLPASYPRFPLSLSKQALIVLLASNP